MFWGAHGQEEIPLPLKRQCNKQCTKIQHRSSSMKGAGDIQAGESFTHLEAVIEAQKLLRNSSRNKGTPGTIAFHHIPYQDLLTCQHCCCTLSTVLLPVTPPDSPPQSWYHRALPTEEQWYTMLGSTTVPPHFAPPHHPPHHAVLPQIYPLQRALNQSAYRAVAQPGRMQAAPRVASTTPKGLLLQREGEDNHIHQSEALAVC